MAGVLLDEGQVQAMAYNKDQWIESFEGQLAIPDAISKPEFQAYKRRAAVLNTVAPSAAASGP